MSGTPTTHEGVKQMSTKNLRPVRDDQHGTITGYVYGCRCARCCKARRERGNEYSSRVSTEACSEVMRALIREADFDGLVIATLEHLGELAGLSRTATHFAVVQLEQDGRVLRDGHESIRGGVCRYQLADGEF